MPWRGPRTKGEFPTLGYLVGEWIEANCVIPDGLHQDEPYRLTDEMLGFLLRFFRLHPNAQVLENRPSAAFLYRGAQLVRPQKWGKSPFGGAICLAYALGPVVFDGWDSAGEPVGRPHPTPWVQIVATSEEQADNVWLSVYEMARRGPIADLAGLDIGLMDLNLPSGGKIEPMTASGRARLGARITFALFDEPHLMTETSGGVLLATTMKRNLAGMGGRWMETTNMYDPSENSIAQRTHESPARDVFIDYRPPPRHPELDDDVDALELLRFVYGDSWWVDPDRILADARDPAVCPTPADALRYFFNLPVVGMSPAVDPTRWDALARPRDLKPKQLIALGFFGARGQSASLVASRVSDGRWFHLNTWDAAAFEDEKIPRTAVDKAVTEAFNAYEVKFLFGEPAHWQEYFDVWAGRWPKRIVEFSTNTERRMDDAISRFQVAFAGDFTHDGNEILAAHAKAAALSKGSRKQSRPEEAISVTQHYLKVIKKHDGGHIDAFVAGILAEVARGAALEKGGNVPPPEPLVAYI